MAQEQIILHKDQTTIFDFTEDTTEPSVPDIDTSSIQIKTKPPYHKDLFPNVVLVQLSKTNYLALIAKDHNTYDVEFHCKKKDGSFNAFIPKYKHLKHIWKVPRLIEKTPEGWNKVDDFKYFLIDKNYCQSFHIHQEKIVELELAFIENDFDKIFKILASIK